MQDTQSLINKRKLLVFTFIFLFFVVVFIIFASLKQMLSSFSLRYPRTNDCSNINSDLKVSKDIALQDREPTFKNQGLGFYQCYCKKYSTYKDSLDKNSLCYDYQFQTLSYKVFQNLITIIIVIINQILKVLNMFTIKSIGFSYESV